MNHYILFLSFCFGLLFGLIFVSFNLIFISLLLTFFWDLQIYTDILGNFTIDGRSGSNTRNTTMNINLRLIQMGSIHLDIYPSLHTRPVSSRSGHCVDTLFRTNSELPPPTKDQLKTYTFPNRLATHMRSSSFYLYTIRQCSLPFKTVGKIIDVASQSTLQTANTAGLHELSM